MLFSFKTTLSNLYKFIPNERLKIWFNNSRADWIMGPYVGFLLAYKCTAALMEKCIRNVFQIAQAMLTVYVSNENLLYCKQTSFFFLLKRAAEISTNSFTSFSLSPVFAHLRVDTMLGCANECSQWKV